MTGARTSAANRAAAILVAPIVPTLLALAFPTTTVLLAQTAVSVAEAYYVGRLGTSALAGVALVFPLVMLMTTMSGGGLGSGVASAVARAVGAGRTRDADAIVFHAVVLGIAAGIAFTALPILGGAALYHALGGRDATLAAAVAYSSSMFAGAIGVWLVNLLSAALRGSGNVKVPALVTFAGALVLIPASPALIFGFGPIPKLGIVGAGITFAAYNLAASLALLRYMASGRSGLSLSICRFERRIFADILKVGLPTALSTVQTNLNVILLTGIVGLFGTSALAAYGIASRLDYILIPILFGVSSAVLTMVGVNIGAENRTRAKRVAWRGAFIGVAVTEAIGLIVGAFPALWIDLFTHDRHVVAIATTYLRIVAPVYGLLGFGFVISFAAQGAGNMLWPFLGVSARLLVAAGVGFVAVSFYGAGLTTLSIVIAASLAIYAGVCAIAMTSGRVWGQRPRIPAAGEIAGSTVSSPSR